MSSLDIAPSPEVATEKYSLHHRGRRRFQASFRRVRLFTFWRLGFRQFRFRHITRASQHLVPYAWARPLVSWHAIVPFTFRIQVSHQAQRLSSNLSLLRRGYIRAPRGAGTPAVDRDLGW